MSYVFKARIAVGTKLLLKLVLLHIGNLYLRPEWEKDEITMEWMIWVI